MPHPDTCTSIPVLALPNCFIGNQWEKTKPVQTSNQNTVDIVASFTLVNTLKYDNDNKKKMQKRSNRLENIVHFFLQYVHNSTLNTKNTTFFVALHNKTISLDEFAQIGAFTLPTNEKLCGKIPHH